MGSHSFKKRATQFKKRVARGVGKTVNKHRRMTRTGSTDSSTGASSFGRPFIRGSRRNNDSSMSKLYCFGKNKSEGPTMISFATSGSTVIASSYSDDHSESMKKHNHSDLYRASSSPPESQVVHPVIYKRDIYIGAQAQKASRESKSKKDPETYKTLVAADPPAPTADVDRRIMEDLSNHPNSKTRQLAPYSVSGSMLYRSMEQTQTKASTSSSRSMMMMSPQKPRGLPANSIMASMLFRTLESTGSVPEIKANNNDDPSIDRTNVPMPVVGSQESFFESSVSSVTMNSANHMDPLLRASSTLLSRLLEKGDGPEDASMLYEM